MVEVLAVRRPGRTRCRLNRQGAQLVNEANIASWLGKQGIISSEFTKYYRSFSVQLKVADYLIGKSRQERAAAGKNK